MKQIFITLSLILGLATSVSANDHLPKAGNCETIRKDSKSGISSIAVMWNKDEAVVKETDTRGSFNFASEKLVLRDHLEFWKISIFYTDDRLESESYPAEIVAFQVFGGDSP